MCPLGIKTAISNKEVNTMFRNNDLKLIFLFLIVGLILPSCTDNGVGNIKLTITEWLLIGILLGIVVLGVICVYLLYHIWDETFRVLKKIEISNSELANIDSRLSSLKDDVETIKLKMP